MKSLDRSGDEISVIQKAMVSVYVNDAFGRVEGFAKQALAAIEEGTPCGPSSPP